MKGKRVLNAAQTYRDFVCDWCGKSEMGHDPRPEGGPWATWCPNQRDPKVKRFHDAT